MGGAGESTGLRVVSRPQAGDDARPFANYTTTCSRNVVQHSHDPLGGVVAAQLMTEGRGGYDRGGDRRGGGDRW